MGHARVDNISRVFNRLIKKGEITIKDVVDELEKRKQTVHASEGEYEERFMLSMATEEIAEWLYNQRAIAPVEPLTPVQKKVFEEWTGGRVMMGWDCGDDGEGGEYAILDSIKWKPLKKRLPVLTDISN